MIFGTFDFFIFLAAVVLLYWLLRPLSAIRKLFLLGVSIYYYWLIDSRFLGLLGLAAIIVYFAGILIQNARQTFLKNIFCFAAIALNAGILFWFKYYDFFRVAAQTFFASIGLPAVLPFWEIAFPVGVSFYVFRMMAYAIDVRRGKYPAERSALDFAVYSFFFPYMLAGPIVRVDEFLPQLKNGGPKEARDERVAAALFFFGLFKKIVISSWLAAVFVEDAFAVPEQFGATGAWLAVLGYTLQIYCDFSGYSDIAIACAMFLGFEFSPNFLFPYRAVSLADFWRRWHISFYSWMRDYVYIPLGGNRGGKIRSFANVITVFALSGLWHGAAGHYLVWGLWHGLGLCFQRLWHGAAKAIRLPSLGGKSILNGLGWLATFLFVGAGWILFRSENMDRVYAVLVSMSRFNVYMPVSLPLAITLAAIFLFVILEKEIFSFIIRIQKNLPFAAWLLMWVAAGLAIYRFAPDTVPPFIYFSF